MTDGWNEPSDAECERISAKDGIKYSDWVLLTGIAVDDDVPLFWIDTQGIRPKPWDEEFVGDAPISMQVGMLRDNERDQVFKWGHAPADLVKFVEADTNGMLWLPDAFVRAVQASKSVEPASVEDAYIVAWHDCTMNADYWFNPRQLVSYQDAAMLMTGNDPLTWKKPVNGGDFDPETSPDYRRFLKRFEGERPNTPRPLREWLQIAMDAGLHESAWVNQYMALTGLNADLESAELNGTAQADDEVVQAAEQPAKPEQPGTVCAECVTEEHDYEAEVAALFDPVKRETLEAMFPDNKKWDAYTERSSRNGLKEAARVRRGYYNPYRAAKWWIDVIAPTSWKWERCLRVLAKNLPTRSRDSEHLLTGDLD